MKTRCSVFALCTLLTLALSCASDEGAASEESDALVAVTKSEEILGLDAMVDEINGYRSADDFTVIAPKAFPQDLDTHLLQLRCPAGSKLIESSVRGLARAATGKRLRQLNRTWSQTGSKVNETVHESAVYDSSGKLRVVVLDVETDHLLDDAYMAKVVRENTAINEKSRALAPLDTGEKKLVSAQLNDDLRTSCSVQQIRIYYSASGVKRLETVRRGLEHADYSEPAAQYAANDVPPVVYSDRLHPSPAKTRFRITALSPTPTVEPVPLPELGVPASQSWVARTLTKPSDDPEAILNQNPVCH